MTILAYSILLSIFWFVVGILVAEPTTIPEPADVTALRKEISKLKNRLEYTQRVVVGQDQSGQMFFDLSEPESDQIVVQYPTIQVADSGEQYRVFYRQIWTPENWRNMVAGKLYVERRETRKKGTYTHKMWVDELTDNDHLLNGFRLDFDKVYSKLPCEWIYDGYQPV